MTAFVYILVLSAMLCVLVGIFASYRRNRNGIMWAIASVLRTLWLCCILTDLTFPVCGAIALFIAPVFMLVCVAILPANSTEHRSTIAAQNAINEAVQSVIDEAAIATIAQNAKHYSRAAMLGISPPR